MMMIIKVDILLQSGGNRDHYVVYFCLFQYNEGKKNEPNVAIIELLELGVALSSNQR